MNICVKCGRAYEPIWVNFGKDTGKPTGRLVIETGRDKVSRTLNLCQKCTAAALDWLKEQKEEGAQEE